MNQITITNSEQFEEVIQTFESTLPKIHDIFANESRNIEEINGTSTWSGETQKVIYGKFKMLEKNFVPIEDSLNIYLKFLKKTLQDYKNIEAHIEQVAQDSDVQLNVNS